MPITFFQVDAFTNKPFSGNPAAVIILGGDMAPELMQSIAAEMNLSETVFLRETPEGLFHIRWFTPLKEVDLCGHATLASAHVLWEAGWTPSQEIQYTSRSGPLSASRSEGWITLDFPAHFTEPVDIPPEVFDSMGLQPEQVLYAQENFIAVLENEQQVRELKPKFHLLKSLPHGLIVTAPGSGEVDFVSRYFVPSAGIDEDPVTGSAHCALTPYWAARLGKVEMLAHQVSPRGGVLRVRVADSRVLISGQAVTVVEGRILRLE